MAVKKSELYSSLWKGCDELRGGMDASQYKDYVLVLLFVKYVSDKYAGKFGAVIDVPEGGGFADMAALKGQKDIGDKINKIISKLAEANDLKGVIDVADFDDADKLGKGKEMQDRLSNLISIFENEALDFSKNKSEGDDLLGDAYEYLMRHFATESGKSKGQFYTPAEVSRIMAKVIGVRNTKEINVPIYDPTCGSGSLLLKAADEAPKGASVYGQEKDNSTRALAKMNMILHGHPTADIWQGNTLASPHFLEGGGLKRFDFVVANPPFSDKAWSNGIDPIHDLYKRFDGFGIPPAKNGDYSFLLHVAASLKSTGKGAIILPHGVLFRGNAEADIRKSLIRKGYIKGIIGLPANLFYGTGIPACIIVLDKENAEGRKGIFMIDASKGYEKDGNKNRLREQDLHKIVDVFTKELEVDKYSRMVSVDEIEQNEFNLNIPRYIDSQEPEDIQDIEAHLLGGIPARDVEGLDVYWQVYTTLKKTLFAESGRKGYYKLNVEHDAIKQAIFSHPEFTGFTDEIDTVFNKWKEKYTPILNRLSVGDKPKKLISEMSEDILAAFEDEKLVDKYDIYQRLMTYWMQTMQDDAYIIAYDGWKAELGPVKVKKGEWDCDLLPKSIVTSYYFKDELKAIEELEALRDDLTAKKEEMEEEYSGEEGILEDLKTVSGKITRGAVVNRVKEIRGDNDATIEIEVLQNYLELVDSEADAGKKVRDAYAELDRKVTNRYKTLTEAEIKNLVINEKWMKAVQTEITSEMERVSHRLTQRIKELAERYSEPLPQIEEEVKTLSKKVEEHLKKMGLVW